MEEEANGGRCRNRRFFELLGSYRTNKLLYLWAGFGVVIDTQLAGDLGWAQWSFCQNEEEYKERSDQKRSRRKKRYRHCQDHGAVYWFRTKKGESGECLLLLPTSTDLIITKNEMWGYKIRWRNSGPVSLQVWVMVFYFRGGHMKKPIKRTQKRPKTVPFNIFNWNFGDWVLFHLIYLSWLIFGLIMAGLF